MDNSPVHRVGLWLSEKKAKKFDLEALSNLCRVHNLELVHIDLNRPLENQGPFAAIIHKMTDLIAQADAGDPESKAMVENFEKYIENHPEVYVLDPVDSIRRLLDRRHTYSSIGQSDLNRAGALFMPAFAELTSANVEENIAKLEEAGVDYPFVCKHVVAHGPSLAHEMALIFSPAYVQECDPPCVAQTFVAHNAVLFKVFAVGDHYFVVERPSLKNFYPADRPTIFFHSHDISKPDSTSSLSILDERERESVMKPHVDLNLVQNMSDMVRKELKMALFGVDVVVQKDTGRYAIIDINAFPGYEGVPDFFFHLTSYIRRLVDGQQVSHGPMYTTEKHITIISNPPEEDSGIETGDSSDEKRNLDAKVRTVRIKRTASVSSSSSVPEVSSSYS